MSFGEGVIKNKSEKGDYAEELIEDYLLTKNFEVFSPSGKQSHKFDGVALNNEDGTVNFFIFDVKSKAARNIYKDTGVDYKHYHHYKKMSEQFNCNFVIFFVDEELQMIYYLNLNKYIGTNGDNFKIYYDEDGIQYPKLENGNKYIYFSLENMKFMRNLSSEEIMKLKEYSKITKKSYKFNPTWDINTCFNKKKQI